MNSVNLIGNIGRDLELKTTPQGKSVLEFSIGVRGMGKDENGNQKTDWVNLVAWEKQAETIAKFHKKGDAIAVSGRITTRSWDNKEGKKQYKTEVIINSFTFVSKGNKDNKSEKPFESKHKPQVMNQYTEENIPF